MAYNEKDALGQKYLLSDTYVCIWWKTSGPCSVHSFNDRRPRELTLIEADFSSRAKNQPDSFNRFD